MQFLLESEENSIEGASGEISYRITEIEKDGVIVPQLKIMLAINRFLTEIKKIKCELGVFHDAHLESISGGSSDPYVIYELTTFSFSFNATNIETLLSKLNQTDFEESEVKEVE